MWRHFPQAEQVADVGAGVQGGPAAAMMTPGTKRTQFAADTRPPVGPVRGEELVVERSSAAAFFTSRHSPCGDSASAAAFGADASIIASRATDSPAATSCCAISYANDATRRVAADAVRPRRRLRTDRGDIA